MGIRSGIDEIILSPGEIEIGSALCYSLLVEENVMEEKEIKELLLKDNEEFRKTFEQHQQFEKRLDKLKAKSFLTNEEELEEKELKKKKLILKDKMYFLMTEYRKSLR